MARIPFPEPTTTLGRIARWYSIKKYGIEIEPVQAALNNPQVLMAIGRMERSIPKWKALSPTLQALAIMASASAIGCSWCMDFGYWEFHNQGVDPRKLRDIPRWHDSDVYSPIERNVLAYAEAMTVTPPAVTDEMVEELRTELSDNQLIELTALIAIENQRSRINSALGFTSQGFKERCELDPSLSSTR